jgi:Ca2+-binding RTX toxin-like protein
MATIRGNNADNTLTGTADNDLIYGFGGNDRLIGLAGSDLLDGGTGNDVLYGDAAMMIEFTQGGNDRLKGAAGNDTFSFAGRSGDGSDGTFGRDVVLDFHRSEDRLAFEHLNGIDGIGDLQIIRQGGDTVITVADYGTVELIGVTATLTASDFTFFV